MAKRESGIETEIINAGAARGFETRKMKFIGVTGCPDRIFYTTGRLLWMEIKRPGKHLEPRQITEVKKLRDAGQEVYVVWRVHEAVRIFDGE